MPEHRHTPESDAAPLLRVERGHAEPEELAALTAVLMARVAAASAGTASSAQAPRPVALWRRPERAAGFDDARTWRRAA